MIIKYKPIFKNSIMKRQLISQLISQLIKISSILSGQFLQHLSGPQRLNWSMMLALGFLGVTAQPGITVETPEAEVNGCPPSALDQATVHVVQANETLASVATTYGVLPSSIMALNPTTQSGAVTTGDRLHIPPYNGSLYGVPSGTTWQELAAQFGMRADVLFESNGCGMTPPQQVFIPGLGGRVTSGSANQPSQTEPLTFNALPLQNGAAIALGYGWQQPSVDTPAIFHSGLDFEASMGTPVAAVAAGTVAFAGEKGSYGKVVVINHDRGVQTRYAQLSDITVTLGDTVTMGDPIGFSGQSGGATMPHLHFEVRLNSPSGWVAQDPSLYLNTLEPTLSTSR